MWKKRMLLYVLVMAVLLVPKQLHAQSLSEEFRDAATLSIGKTIVESQTYYKYTAQEAQTLQISFGNIIECSPNVTIYDSEGREIFYFNETYFYFPMQKGQTCYVRAGGAYEEEESYQLNVKVDSHDAGIKNVEILDAPSLVGYRELDDELMDWIGENVYSCFFRDLKIRVEWEDGTVSTEQFAVQEYNPTWLIADGLVYENNEPYRYVYYKGYLIKIKFQWKSTKDIKVQPVTEKEAFMVSYQQGNWVGCSFTPTESGYYDINYSATGTMSYVLVDDKGESMVLDCVGVNRYPSELSIPENDRRQNVYLSEGHTYYFYSGTPLKKVQGKFLFKKSFVQQRYMKITVDPLQDVSYTGKEHTPLPIVRYEGVDINELGWAIAYNYSYNTEPGVAMVKILCNSKGKNPYYYDGNYTLYVPFVIRQPIKDASVTIPDYDYTGSAVLPEVVVRLSGKTLQQDKDYTIKVMNNVDAGQATVIVDGIGKYEGSIKKNFTINQIPRSLEVNDSFIKHKKSKPFKLKAQSDGSLTYKSSNDKVATVDSKGKVKVKDYGTAIITVSAAGDKNHCKTTKKVRIIVTSNTSKINSVKKTSKNKALVKLKKATGAQGYEIIYSTDLEFKSSVQKVKTKKTTATIKQLKKGVKYYIKVRSYRTVKGKKLYSDYSKVKAYKH